MLDLATKYVRSLCLASMLVLAASLCPPANGQPQAADAAASAAAAATSAPASAPASANRSGTSQSSADQPVTPPLQTPAGPACAACPPHLTATDVRAVVDAASAVQAAAKNLKKEESFWASVGVNLFSSRLDAWLFGRGSENQGLVALMAAWFTLAAAVVKLALAWNLPGGASGPPSKTRRVVEITLSLVLCVSGALAVLAVHTARTTAAAAVAPSDERAAELSACQRNLQFALAEQVAGRAAQPAVPTEVLKSVEAACQATAAEARTRFGELQNELKEVRSSQVGFLPKLWIFLGFCGVAMLVWRARSQPW